MTETLKCDVLILGCGIAGCVAALQAAQCGLHVIIVTRTTDPKETNTYYAQGGIIYRGEVDSPQDLSKDIIHAGGNHCNPTAVSILAQEGPDLLKDLLLDELNVAFDRNSNGELSLIKEGGHGIARILHAADATGRSIQIALLNALRNQPNITLLTAHTAVDLLTPSHHSQNRLAVYESRSCLGAYILNQQSSSVIRAFAKKTILATGGLGQIFLRTSNPSGARGDGLAMAYRAGARVINTEFIQFHPTTFHDVNAPHFLISEAVRGAGARLVHANNKPFMDKYAPEWKDLAPRDIVARAIHQEILKNDLPNVYLNLRDYIPLERIKSHFPNIHAACLKYGIDITTDLVPVVPAAHYTCGGVWCDDWGQTTIRNLYAIGEVACTGVHGANRLASTSLLEGLVWGHRAARHIHQNLPHQFSPYLNDIPAWYTPGHIPPDPALISQDMSQIRHVMWNYVGLVRTAPRLQRAIRELRNLEVEIERFYQVTSITDSFIGLRNAVRAAIVVTQSAWENKRSMGCHFRE